MAAIKIPNTLVPTLMLMKAQSKTLEEMQQWLQSAHNINVNVATISKRCRFSTKLNRTLTKAIWAKASADGAEGIVNAVVNNLDEIAMVASKLLQENNIPEWRLTKKLEAEYIRLHLEMFGKSETSREDELEDINEILARIGSPIMDTTNRAIEDAEFDQILEKDDLPQVMEQEHQDLMEQYK